MALTPKQTAQLERLRNFKTRYEIVAQWSRPATDWLGKIEPPAVQRRLAGYTSRKNILGLISMLRKHADAWQTLTGCEEITTNKGSVQMGAWHFCFSGRTQRDAIIGGELPFILESEPVKQN